jgi:hypothetical protein
LVGGAGRDLDLVEGHGRDADQIGVTVIRDGQERVDPLGSVPPLDQGAADGGDREVAATAHGNHGYPTMPLPRAGHVHDRMVWTWYSGKCIQDNDGIEHPNPRAQNHCRYPLPPGRSSTSSEAEHKSANHEERRQEDIGPKPWHGDQGGDRERKPDDGRGTSPARPGRIEPASARSWGAQAHWGSIACRPRVGSAEGKLLQLAIGSGRSPRFRSSATGGAAPVSAGAGSGRWP